MASEENGNGHDHGPSMDKVSQFLKESQDRIFVNNKAWVDSKISGDSDFFTKLSSGQKPDYLYGGLFLSSSLLSSNLQFVLRLFTRDWLDSPEEGSFCTFKMQC